MTLIAAMVDNRKVVHMMADSQATMSNGGLIQLAFPKVAVKTVSNSNDRILIGGSGTALLTFFCTTKFRFPPLPAGNDKQHLHDWLMMEVRDKLRKDAAKADILISAKEGNKELQGPILVAVRGHVFRIDPEMIPVARAEPYDAIGIGSICSFGAMHFARYGKSGLPSAKECRRTLLISLRGASKLVDGIAPPFTYINTEGKTETIDM